MDVQKKAPENQEPTLCRLCQKFYGTQKLDWLCSSCHKTQPAQPSSPKLEPVHHSSPPAQVTKGAGQEEEEVKPVVRQADRKRCFACNKKVGLLGLECRCELVFCNSHRLPECHGCEFNHKQKGIRQLQAKTVKVQKAKLQQI